MSETALPIPRSLPPAAPSGPQLKTVGPNETPLGALEWSDQKTKAHALRSWRRAVSRTFPESGRTLRVGWALEWFFSAQGFAYCSDAFLAAETGVAINKVQSALRDLEAAGAIIRRHAWVSSRECQRRIFPLTKIIETAALSHPTVGVGGTPHNGTKPHPTVGGLKTYGRGESLPSEMLAARRSAALRERFGNREP